MTTYLLLVFNENVNIISVNSAATAREMLSSAVGHGTALDAARHCRMNRGSLELEMGQRLLRSSSASAIRGMSFNIVFLDGLRLSPTIYAIDFLFRLPTISSGKKSK